MRRRIRRNRVEEASTSKQVTTARDFHHRFCLRQRLVHVPSSALHPGRMQRPTIAKAIIREQLCQGNTLTVDFVVYWFC